MSELSLNAPVSLMDFGCGGSITTLGLALCHPDAQFYGVDIGDKHLQLPELAKEQLKLQALPENLHLHQIDPLQSLMSMAYSAGLYSSIFPSLRSSRSCRICTACCQLADCFFCRSNYCITRLEARI